MCLARRCGGRGPYLEFGCGTGHLLEWLSAVDSSSGLEILECSAATARTVAPGCEVTTDMAPLKTSAFSGDTAIHVLAHLEESVSTHVPSTWNRVLAPGGGVPAVMPEPGGRARRLYGSAWLGLTDEKHINLKPYAEWRTFIEDHGFSVVKEGSGGLRTAPCSTLPKPADAALRSGLALAQFLSGRVVLRPGAGEPCIFILQKR